MSISLSQVACVALCVAAGSVAWRTLRLGEGQKGEPRPLVVPARAEPTQIPGPLQIAVTARAVRLFTTDPSEGPNSLIAAGVPFYVVSVNHDGIALVSKDAERPAGWVRARDLIPVSGMAISTDGAVPLLGAAAEAAQGPQAVAGHRQRLERAWVVEVAHRDGEEFALVLVPRPVCTPLAAPATQDHDSPRIAFVIDADPQFRPESLAAPVRLLAAAVSREHPTARYAVTWIRDENPTSWTSFSNALGDLGRLKKGLDDGINELRARAGATKPASIEVGFDAARREIGDGGGATAMVLISSQLARPGERVVRVQPTDLDVGKALRAIRGELERRRDPKPEPERVPEEGTSASDFASNADFTRSWVRVSPPDTGAVVTRHRLVSRAEIGRAVEALGLAARYASCTLAEVGDLPIDPQRRLAELANLNAQSGVPAILSLTPSDIRASPRRGDLVAALRDAEQRLDDLQRHPDLNDGCTLIPDHLLSFPASCGDP